MLWQATKESVDPNTVVFALYNRTPWPLTLQWIPPGEAGKAAKAVGRLAAALSENEPRILNQRTFRSHSFQIVLSDGRMAGPFVAGSDDHERGVVTAERPDREGVVRVHTTVDIATWFASASETSGSERGDEL